MSTWLLPDATPRLLDLTTYIHVVSTRFCIYLLPRCLFTSSHYTYCISSNRRHPQIVAAQSEALERNECHPRIVAVGSKCGMHTCVQMILTTVTMLALGLFVLYESFPRLTAGLRGCVYYWQHLATVTVSLVPTLYPAVVDVSKLSKEIIAALE